MNDGARISREQLGWKPVFQQQLMDFDPQLQVVRVVAVHRTGLTVAPDLPGGVDVAVGGRWFQGPPEDRPTVGDWILVNPATGALEAVLERISLIKRLAPSGEVQLIAANIDTAFLVTSANEDFNLPRLERYLTAVLEADIQPVIVITKADTVEDITPFVDAAQSLGADLPVYALNALDPEQVATLAPWGARGQSIALLGSSGVGKSTLVNTLCGEQVQRTQEARVDDDKGRHTTTHRSIHLLPEGGVILDSPGMREFQLAEAEQGVSALFADIDELALQCRFNDCSHATEPGCAVQAAIADGILDERRLQSYYKLQREERFNTETIAERHARVRAFGKMVKAHTKPKK